jgi:hypothetical protein
VSALLCLSCAVSARSFPLDSRRMWLYLHSSPALLHLWHTGLPSHYVKRDISKC